MIDIYKEIKEWVEQKKEFALAIVVKTWGSAPRPIGSSMAISKTGEILGSVSGGCVEGDVSQNALAVLNEQKSRLVHYGVSDEEAWTVGLSCGGKIDVFIQPFFSILKSGLWEKLDDAVSNNLGVCVLYSLKNEFVDPLIIDNNGSHLGNESLLNHSSLAEKALQERTHLYDSEAAIFAHLISPKSKLIIIGAAHITVDLVDFGKQFGFEVIVIDPRGFFAENTVFRIAPDECITDWPAEVLENYNLDQFTYVVTLSHDPKIDDQALQILLRSKVAYIGALGSKRTHQKRINRLAEHGFSEVQIDQIHAPVGESINAKIPKEIALSVIAQIVKIKNQYR